MSEKNKYDFKKDNFFYKDSIKEKIKSDFVKFDVFEGSEYLYYDLDTDTSNDDIKKSEQIIYILLRLWVEQNNSDHFDTYKFSKDKETIINQIKSGNCLVINLGDHAVNATAIYRDIDDPNLYYLKGYDTNSPMQEVYYKIISTDEGTTIKSFKDNTINVDFCDLTLAIDK